MNRVGEKQMMNNGLMAKIIEYRGAKDIDVEFEDGYIKQKCSYYEFKEGSVRNPYAKTIFNIGYYGDYDHFDKKIHSIWYSMLSRCYNIHNKYYKNYGAVGVTVCEEWHCFSNFQKWYEDNIYEITNENIQLDKDVLIKGNKIYSPERCIFVPQRINEIFKRSYDIDKCGIEKRNDKYRVKIQINKKMINLGTFNTIEEAKECYLKAKCRYIKDIAEEYKDKIPSKLYNSLIKISNNGGLN